MIDRLRQGWGVVSFSFIHLEQKSSFGSIVLAYTCTLLAPARATAHRATFGHAFVTDYCRTAQPGLCVFDGISPCRMVLHACPHHPKACPMAMPHPPKSALVSGKALSWVTWYQDT